MTWVRRAATKQEHTCGPPGQGGHIGDLWRCDDDCRVLWRVGDACNLCDSAGYLHPHGGQHDVGQVWRPATTLQRLTAWIADVRQRTARREAAP